MGWGDVPGPGPIGAILRARGGGLGRPRPRCPTRRARGLEGGPRRPLERPRHLPSGAAGGCDGRLRGWKWAARAAAGRAGPRPEAAVRSAALSFRPAEDSPRALGHAVCSAGRGASAGRLLRTPRPGFVCKFLRVAHGGSPRPLPPERGAPRSRYSGMFTCWSCHHLRWQKNAIASACVSLLQFYHN